jgi:hypothetical protein
MSKTTSRRAVLAGAATLPALAVPAVAGSLAPDPIFAAIENHRKLWALCCDGWARIGELEESLPASKRTWSWNFYERQPPANCSDDPRWIENELHTWNVLAQEADDAAWAMLEHPPTTMGGLDALNAYAGEFTDAGHEWPDGWDRRLYNVTARLAEALS